MTQSPQFGVRAPGRAVLCTVTLALATCLASPACEGSEPQSDDLLRAFDPEFTPTSAAPREQSPSPPDDLFQAFDPQFTLASLRKQQSFEPEGVPAPEASPTDESEMPQFKPMSQMGVNIALPPGREPQDLAKLYAVEHPPSVGAVLVRGWPVLTYNWTAPASRHNPLYFEEVNAERYGYSCCYLLQPGISAVHFFATIPALPYLMTANCPCETVYTLGHYPPGNCNPWQRHCWPCDFHAASMEFLAVMSVIAVIP